MRIATINVNNNQTNRPAFGMKVAPNDTLRKLCNVLADNNCTKEEITNLFMNLDKKFDNSFKLKFDNWMGLYSDTFTERLMGHDMRLLNSNYKGYNFLGVIGTDADSRQFRLYIDAKAKDKNIILKTIESKITEAGKLVDASFQKTKTALDSVLSDVFKK